MQQLHLITWIKECRLEEAVVKVTSITRTNCYIKKSELSSVSSWTLVYGFVCTRTGSGMDFCMPHYPFLLVFHLHLNLHQDAMVLQ